MVVVERGVTDLHERQILKSMFEARKQVFVDLLKWDVPVLDGRFEIDQFDDSEAIYLIIAGPGGEHLGSARLLKTTGPHILGTVFPDLCVGPPPSGAGILEITRFCLGRNQSAAGRRRTRDQLLQALVRFALERAVHTYTGVAEIAWLQQILAFGWQCRPLGPPRRLDCGILGALAISIDSATPLLLARNGIEDDSQASGMPEAA